jgi:hypothetical protein
LGERDNARVPWWVRVLGWLGLVGEGPRPVQQGAARTTARGTGSWRQDFYVASRRRRPRRARVGGLAGFAALAVARFRSVGVERRGWRGHLRWDAALGQFVWVTDRDEPERWRPWPADPRERQGTAELRGGRKSGTDVLNGMARLLVLLAVLLAPMPAYGEPARASAHALALQHQRARAAYQRALRPVDGILHHDRLLAAGAHGDDRDGHLQDAGDALEVGLRVGR